MEIIVKGFTKKAVKKAIKKVERAGGGTVFLPPGVYGKKTRVTIKLPKNVCLKGLR